jgi:SAM-dependent methyltransferase
MRVVDRLLQRWRAAAAEPWIERGARVLDVGCHRGELLTRLRARIGPSVGLDPVTPVKTDPPIRLIADRFPPAEPLPAGSFDVVVLLATLEHIADKDAVAAECARVLRPTGRVVATVPSWCVDRVVDALRWLRLADGMSIEEHHGYDPLRTPEVFTRHGFELERWRRFQLGLNHLFVFRKAAPGRVPA